LLQKHHWKLKFECLCGLSPGRQMGKACLWDIFAFDFSLKLHKNQNHFCAVEFSVFPEWLSNIVSSFTAKADSSIAAAVVCKGLLFCLYLSGHYQTAFHTCFLLINSTYGDRISCASLHIIRSRRSEALRLTIVSIQICLLKNPFQERKQKAKPYRTNINFIMVLGCSVNIKLIKIIWTEVNYFRTQHYRFVKIF